MYLHKFKNFKNIEKIKSENFEIFDQIDFFSISREAYLLQNG